MRKKFQGVRNILRFNWHYYVLATLLIIFLFLGKHYLSFPEVATNTLLFLIICPTFISLAVSTFVYDCSNLYRLSWLNNLRQEQNEMILNVHAGFDETSGLLKNRFPYAELIVADFFDPVKHTEVSINRARIAYPPYPNTLTISTTKIPIQDNSANKIFIILSAHEIRCDMERIAFFKELFRILKPTGQIIITEHLRDTANFFAYNVGFLHFYSKSTWLKAFSKTGLKVSKEIKTTHFITTFILEKNGTAS